MSCAPPAPFAITTRFERGVAIVAPRGELDLASAGRLRSALESLRNAGWRFVDVDLRRVEFMDASGLGVLVQAHGEYASADADLRVSYPSDPVRRLFEVAHRVRSEAHSDTAR